MGRQVKSIARAYLCNSLIQVTQYTTGDRGGSTVVVRRTSEWDCRGLTKIIRRGEQAGEKTLDLTAVVSCY